MRRIAPLIVLLALTACGGGGSNPTPVVTPPIVITVAVAPTTATVVAGATKQFTATVTGPSNTNVTWTASGGTVSATGLFTASANAGPATVTATSVADTTKSASAAVTVTAAPPPQKTSYGVFRALKAKTAASTVFSSKMVSAQPKAAIKLNASALSLSAPSTALTTARFAHSATVLPSGHILVSGGCTDGTQTFDPSITPSSLLTSHELFDPSTETFSAITSVNMVYPRWGHATSVLDDGSVFIAGGDSMNSMEVFNPMSAQSYIIGSVPGISTGITSYYLGKNLVLLYGSNNSFPFNPCVIGLSNANGTWSQGGNSALDNGSWKLLVDASASSGSIYQTLAPASVQLQDGRVLVSGGDIWTDASNFYHNGDPLTASNDISIFDPATMKFTSVGTMRDARSGHTMLDLGDGKVAIYGGRQFNGTNGQVSYNILTSVEVFDLSTMTSSFVGTLAGVKSNMDSSFLQTGVALLSGGRELRLKISMTKPGQSLYA